MHSDILELASDHVEVVSEVARLLVDEVLPALGSHPVQPHETFPEVLDDRRRIVVRCARVDCPQMRHLPCGDVRIELPASDGQCRAHVGDAVGVFQDC